MTKVMCPNNLDYFEFFSAGSFEAPCVVITPGGGYDHTSAREAKNVADEFLKRHIHAAVLYYRESLDSYPTPMDELGFTITYLRKNYKKLKIKKDKIISIGFSAGGHLALANAIYGDEYSENGKPNYLILCYPVVSSSKDIWHEGSFNNLLKDKISDSLLDKLSLERHIPADLPDVFLWHTFTDNSVSVLNSIRLLEALKEKDINVECHLFPEGGHGLSLADDTTMLGDITKKNSYVHRWVQMMFEWIIRKNIK